MNHEKSLTKDWKSILAEYEQSGISQNTFCQKNDINIATFKYHRSRILRSEKPQTKQSFVEVRDNLKKPINELTDTKSDWKLSISFMGVVAFEIRLG